MLAFARRSRPLSSINSNLLIPAALQSLETVHHASQQGGWCSCALQQALLHAGHTDHRGQASVFSVREHSYHVSDANWGTPSLGHRCYSTQQPRAVNAVSQGNTRSFDPVSLSNLTPGKRKYKRRRARGGGDKQAGRGFNGQKSRSGTGKPALFFEGGQTPMWKMLPRKGFTNNFRCEYDNVLLSEIEAFIRAGKLDPTRVITVKHMYDAGLLERKAYNRDGVQVLAQAPSRRKARRLQGVAHQTIPQQFEIPVDLEVQRVSARARDAIEAAGGRVTRTFYNPLGMRAVLLPEWFTKKGRLLPRAVQMVPYKKQWRFDATGTIPARDAPALEDMPPPEATDGPPGGGELSGEGSQLGCNAAHRVASTG